MNKDRWNVAALLAGLLLFAVSGGTAFVRSSPLGAALRDSLPAWAGPAVRAAVAGIGVYLGAGALLVAGSLVVHHQRVEELSRQRGVQLRLVVPGQPDAALGGRGAADAR